MDSALTEVGLPIALGIIMFGLGLGLTVADFRRVGKHPKAVVVALSCQLVLLPAVCFGLVLLFDLPAARRRHDAARRLAGRHHRQPVQPSLPRRRRAQHHADRHQLDHLDRHPAADHQPRDQLLRPGRRRLDAARRGGQGLPADPGAGGHRHARAREQAVVRPVDGQPGADRLGGDPGDPGARHPARSATTWATTSPTSAWWPRCSARSAWWSGTSCPARSAWSRTRRSPRRWRSACTTGRWRSSWPRTSSTAPRSRSRQRSTRC